MGTLILLIIIAVIIYYVVGASPNRSRAVNAHPSGRKSQTSRSFEPNRRSRTEGPPPSMAEAIRESAGCWLPPGEDARVAGYDLRGGMLYLGGRMRALRGWGASDPALLDMSLRVNRGRPDHAG